VAATEGAPAEVAATACPAVAHAEAAATAPPAVAHAAWGPVVMAALALPGVAPAQVEPVPGERLVAFKWLSYDDWQPGLDRIRVLSPSVLLRMPLGERWAVEGSLTADRVSGASPRWHTAVSSASRMSDTRRAGDVKVTRLDERRSLTLGLAASSENDFDSRAVSLAGAWASDDNNRTWNAGIGFTRDRIGSTDDPALDESRRTVEATGGVTQALSRADIVQAGLTLAYGNGFYDDPYKRPDQRPDQRRQVIGQLRWNHHFEDAGITLRSSLRGYRDNFGIRSTTLQFEPVFQLIDALTVTPSLRLYTQRAASFYFDPVYSFTGAPEPPGFPAGDGLASADQRLAAFGAVTLGIKLAVTWGDGWSADLKLDRYEQRSDWRVGGPGSPGLEPFSARFVQVGLARRF
jgi:Protein of unknown function (DUF3570)